MSTTDDLAQIERMLDRKQVVPSAMVRSLIARCKTLMIICGNQGKKIKELEGKLDEVQKTKEA